MARQMRSNFSNELLTTPPPIVWTEVSARWKRTWKGEVIMTVIMPSDVVDTEVYVKTPQGHIGIQMDPWMSCSWKRTWNSTHPPNTQTKEKIRKYKLQKAGRRISLFRTAGGRPTNRFRNSHWSPRPEKRCHTHHPNRRTPSPTKSPDQGPRQSPFTKVQMAQKRERGTGLTPLKVPLKQLTTERHLKQARSNPLFSPLNPHLNMKRDLIM